MEHGGGRDGRPARGNGWRGDAGQTFTEYTMILGLVTAMILLVTSMVVPAVAYVIVRLVDYLYIFLT
ncbi:MAG: hypothetical protein U0Q12_15145 [Vicinamibacterales bacterium]